MTIPAIFYSATWLTGAAAGLVPAVIAAIRGKELTTIALSACAAVLMAELLQNIFL